MGKGIFSQQTHTNIQFFSFALIAIGMPSTKVLMSFGLVFAIANWILEGGFKEKWNSIRSNRLLQLLIAFYLLLIIGLIWSWDVTQGLKDLKSRLPMLFLPLILGTSPLMDVRQINRLLQLFLSTLLVTSVFNVLYFHNIIGSHTSDDIRGLSRFASHIRYGLLISLGFGICIWFQLSNKRFLPVYTFLALWLGFYTFYSQVLSGVLVLILILLFIIFFLLYQYRKVMGYLFFSIIIICVGWTLTYLLILNHEEVDCKKLPPLTENGIPYNHNCQIFSEINGKAIFTYYSEIELYREWIQVSKTDFMGSDKKGALLRVTTARYMTSKGLSKDAKGFKHLTKEDIRNIIDGYTYANERNEMIMPRIYGIKYQILNNQFPNGHSLLQRIEHWKTSVYIIKKHWLVGVGTGGNQKVFDQAYAETNSPLTMENRLRSHNMYLTYTVSYGVFGLAFFLVLLGTIFLYAWRDRNLFSLMFIVLISGSFLFEDTLETQLGVTIFGFFTALLLYFHRLNHRQS
jgi:hypothetical protein